MQDAIIDNLTPFVPLLLSLVFVLGGLALLHRLLIGNAEHLSSTQKLPRQFSLLVMTIVGLVVIVLCLPVSDSTRNQILALIGVLLSGVIAFSSTAVVSNLMAGLVLRVNRPFRVGDFVRVEGFSGRVTDMGLLDTEIQSDSRELISFANSMMVTSPVTVVRASGAIVSVELSLGYELYHGDVEKHLLSAAENCGLEEPFVQVVSLGDFSVTYRVAGLLKDVKSLLSARSKLHKSVLDALHGAGIEIVSPTFMNQRPQEKGSQMIPRKKSSKVAESEKANPESIVFDKAEQAEEQVKQREAIEAEIKSVTDEISEASGEEKDALKAKKEELKQKLAELKTADDEEESST